MGSNKCEDCCRNCCQNCCYSTPLLSLSLLCVSILGLVGFGLSGIYGLARMDTLPHVEEGITLMAPIVCGTLLITILPLVMVTIMAYCTTGYIRDILFHRVVKFCVGSVCLNVFMLLVLVAFIMLWVLIAVGLGGITAYYVQVDRFCAQRELNATMGAVCLYYADRGLNFFPICNEAQVNELCSNDGRSVGLAFSISLIFSIVVILGLISQSLVHLFNHVTARDNMDYRENNRTEYDMKRVR